MLVTSSEGQLVDRNEKSHNVFALPSPLVSTAKNKTKEVKVS